MCCCSCRIAMNTVQDAACPCLAVLEDEGERHFAGQVQSALQVGQELAPQAGAPLPRDPRAAATSVAGSDRSECWPTPVDPRQAALIAAIQSLSGPTPPWSGLPEIPKEPAGAFDGRMYKCPSSPHLFSILCAVTGHPRPQTTAGEAAASSLDSMPNRLLNSSVRLLDHQSLEGMELVGARERVQNARKAPLPAPSCPSGCPPAPANSHKANLMQAIESYLVSAVPLPPQQAPSQEQFELPGSDMEWNLRQGVLP